MKDNTRKQVEAMGVWAVSEPYDSVVRILTKLQYKAAKHDLTGVHDAANEIMALFAPNTNPKSRSK